MSSPKQQLREMLDRLPEDCSFEDLHYHIYVLQSIQAGMESAENEPTLTQEEVEERLAKWLI